MNHLDATGVFAHDQFMALDWTPDKRHQKAVYVFNSEPSWKSGEHWLLCYLDGCGHVVFVDSYGKSPQIYNVEHKLKTMGNYLSYIDNWQLQDNFSAVCAEYALFFGFLLCRHKELHDILRDYFHPTDRLLNDQIVREFVNATFPGYQRSIEEDAGFILTQTVRSLLMQ